MDCFIHISGNIPCYTGQCKKQKQYMGPIFKLKRWETANNYNTVLKSVAEIISIYVHMYNCIYNWRALIALRFIRDLLYNILFSLKALVFIWSLKLPKIRHELLFVWNLQIRKFSFKNKVRCQSLKKLINTKT